MTSIENFTTDFSEIVNWLDALGSTVVFANIPDVNKIAFLVDRNDLVNFLGSD
jgi:hypothetical protein